jgi:hypothetical protein
VISIGLGWGDRGVATQITAMVAVEYITAAEIEDSAASHRETTGVSLRSVWARDRCQRRAWKWELT